MSPIIKRPVCECGKCSHIWLPQKWLKTGELPKSCPRCKSKQWNVARVYRPRKEK